MGKPEGTGGCAEKGTKQGNYLSRDEAVGEDRDRLQAETPREGEGEGVQAVAQTEGEGKGGGRRPGQECGSQQGAGEGRSGRRGVAGGASNPGEW